MKCGTFCGALRLELHSNFMYFITNRIIHSTRREPRSKWRSRIASTLPKTRNWIHKVAPDEHGWLHPLAIAFMYRRNYIHPMPNQEVAATSNVQYYLILACNFQIYYKTHSKKGADTYLVKTGNLWFWAHFGIRISLPRYIFCLNPGLGV